MEIKKKSFLLHIDSLDVLDDMTNEQAGLLLKAMKAFHKGEEIELDPLTKMAFSFFKNQFIRDNEKYLKTCEARAQAGSKGGKQKQQNLANASKCKQKVAKVADKDNKNDSDKDSDSDNKTKRTVSPSLDYSSWPTMPSDDLFNEWKSLRKRLKANVTQTVINRTGKELQKAVQNGFTVEQCFEQWIYKGWRGFEADWMRGIQPRQNVNHIGNNFSKPEGWQ